MYRNVSEHDFINISNQYHQHKDNFSYDGKKALYKYLVDLEDATGEIMEMDWIAFCCEYSEYDSQEELLDNYDEKNLNDIMDKTDVIEFKHYDKPQDYMSDNWTYRYIVLDY